DEARVEEADIQAHVRNASDLPVNVVQLAYEVRTSWMVSDAPPESPVPAYLATPGDGSVQAFLNDFRVPPGETLDMPYRVNVAHLGWRPIPGVNGGRGSGFLIRLGDGGDSFGAISGHGGGDCAGPQLAGRFEQRAAQVLEQPQAVWGHGQAA